MTSDVRRNVTARLEALAAGASTDAEIDGLHTIITELLDRLDAAAVAVTDALLRVTIHHSDVDALAEEHGIDHATAQARAGEWARHIEATATALVNEELAAVVQHDQP